MKAFLFALLCLPSLAFAQWSNGLGLWPKGPVAIGSQLHGSIAFGVRCLNEGDDCDNLTGAGQRGISCEPIFNNQASVYATCFHGQVVLRKGTDYYPLLMSYRAVSPVLGGNHVGKFVHFKFHDIIGPDDPYVIETDAGKVSFGDHTEVRAGGLSVNGGLTVNDGATISGDVTGGLAVNGSAGTRTITVKNGTIISIYDAKGAEVGRLQGVGGDVYVTTLTGGMIISGLAGASLRPVCADPNGKLVVCAP